MKFSTYLQTLSISTSFVVIVGSYLVRVEIEASNLSRVPRSQGEEETAWEAKHAGILRQRSAANGSSPFQAGSKPVPSPRMSREMVGLAPDSLSRPERSVDGSVSMQRPRGSAPVGPSFTLLSSLGRERSYQQTFQDLAERASGLCGVPPDLFARLVQRESTWRQYDRLGRVLKSSSGALGLAQVKPLTGRGVSKTLDLNDPWQNLLAGSCYLRQMYDRFGTWERAVMAYRVGPSGLSTERARAYVQDVMEGVE